DSVVDGVPPLMVKAKRCIKAFGFSIAPNKPMKFSSDQVQSITPESKMLTDGVVAKDEKPVYIVGGGKTSMDVAGLILSQNPNRKINFIIGKGTFFLNRETFFPNGAKKYWKGVSVYSCLIDSVLKYDHNNVRATTDYVKKRYCLAPFSDAIQTFIGLLSPEESETITGAVDNTWYDYLEDVKENTGTLKMCLRSGQKEPVKPGSWFINCTGHIFPKVVIPEPVLSPHQTVLNIEKTNSTLIFTSFAGYFLPHLWYRNQFQRVPIIYFNHQDLARKDRETYLYAFGAQAIHNQLRFFEALPLSVMYNCGLNYDKWFPLSRQLPMLIGMLSNKKKYLKATTTVLDQINKKYDIAKGVVGQH
ncbi:MAG: hypothetical protein AAFO69_13565, partial [Bacteroidota bacterium]